MTNRRKLMSTVYCCFAILVEGCSILDNGHPQPPIGIQLPHSEIVTNLALRLITSSERFAGTCNGVYFDTGPLSWKLDRKLEMEGHRSLATGSDNLYSLPLPCQIEITTDDIVWLRLQKKGILGFNGLWGGFGGAWKPDSMQLIVNGKPYEKIPIDQWLDRKNAKFTQPLNSFTPNSPEDQFRRTIRLRPNEPLKRFGELVAVLTTSLGKDLGISGWKPSGWLDGPLPLTCASGTVMYKPGVSTDGLATIDLQLESLEIGCAKSNLYASQDSKRPRYIRVEYRFRGNPIPKKGDHVRICGQVKWDTDDEGWYEIHPSGPSDVTVLDN